MLCYNIICIAVLELPVMYLFNLSFARRLAITVTILALLLAMLLGLV